MEGGGKGRKHNNHHRAGKKKEEEKKKTSTHRAVIAIKAGVVSLEDVAFLEVICPIVLDVLAEFLIGSVDRRRRKHKMHIGLDFTLLHFGSSSCSADSGQRGAQQRHSHPGAGGLVDDHRLPAGVHIVVQAKVGSHAVQQHPVVGRHGRELPLLATAGRRDDSVGIGCVRACLDVKYSQEDGSAGAGADEWSVKLAHLIVLNSMGQIRKLNGPHKATLVCLCLN